MSEFTNEELEEALRAIASMISKSEKAYASMQQKGADHGKSQLTLLKNRIKALRVAETLVLGELQGQKQV